MGQIIGARGDDDNGFASGSAYVFRYDGNQWVEEGKLTASDADEQDIFGESVAMTENTGLIGAFGDDENGSEAGAAYIFDL